MTRSETFICCIIACVISVAVAASMTMALDNTAADPKEPGKAEFLDLKVKSLEVTGAITVRGEKGKGSVAIQVTGNGPGVWLTSPRGDYVNICALDDGTNHTVYLMKKDGKFGNVGIAMTPSGEAIFQFKDSKGNPRQLPLEKLADLPLDKLLNSTTK